MRCIFCLEEHPSSDEHVFPEAIGGLLHTQRVCKDCNSFLGSLVDAPLTDHLFAVIRRSELGLSGKNGIVPDAIEAVLGHGTLTDDPTKRFRLKATPDTGGPELRLITTKNETNLEDGTPVLQFAIDAKDAGQIGPIIQKVRKRNGLAPLSAESLASQVAEAMANDVIIEGPELHHQVTIDLVGFHRGLLKIVYELAFIWLGESYLDDPTAAKLRDVILGRVEEAASMVRGQINLGCAHESLAPWALDKNFHVAFSFSVGRHMVIAVKVFDIFSAVIEVSENALTYLREEMDSATIRFLSIDPASRQIRETSFKEEIMRQSDVMNSPTDGFPTESGRETSSEKP